jgi:GMP synthase-like glutamine amidotransferase
MSRCLVVQHVHPESPYAIGDALAAHGLEVDLRRVFAGQALPDDLDGYAGMVVMGGPMSAGSDAGFPSRRAEVALLAQAIDRRLPTLGVCLGAQLLALAAGGEVLSGVGDPEIGWGPVSILPATDDPLLGALPASLDVFHWHGDTFRLPAGATVLASSARYVNQAFRIGDTAWGLQFHLEVDGTAVATMVEAFPEDLVAVPGGTAGLLADSGPALDRLSPYRDQVLGSFAALVAIGDRLRQSL